MNEKRIYIFDLDSTVRRTKSGKVCPNVPEDQEILPNVKDRLTQLKNKGNIIIACSSQGGVSRGIITEFEAWKIAIETDRLLGNIFDDIRLVFYKKGGIQSDYYYETYSDAPKAIELSRITDKYGSMSKDNPVFVGDAYSDMDSSKEHGGIDFIWSHRFFSWKNYKQTHYGYQYCD